MRELILLRTHVFDDATMRLYDDLKATSNRDVLIVCEESNAVVDVGQGRPKLSVTRRHFIDMGLHAPPNFGWLCGDYVLYAGLEAFPRYDRYWLFEYDVRLGFGKSADFFDRFLDNPTDVLAFQVRRAGPQWSWYEPMLHFAPKVHACNFSLIAVSRAAALTALQARREMSRAFPAIAQADPARRWPNDESFLATTTVVSGLTLLGFNRTGRTYATETSFKEGVPLSDLRIARQPEDFLVHHPVHSGQRFLNKTLGLIGYYQSRNMSHDRARAIFDAQLRQDVLAECGAEGLAAFDAAFDEWMGVAAGPLPG